MNCSKRLTRFTTKGAMTEAAALPRTLTPLQTASEYYSGFLSTRPGLSQKFKNIDEEVHFREYQKLLLDARTQNFVLDFGNDDAWCGVNLNVDDLVALMDAPRPKIFGTRWINIWAPERQKQSIKYITKQYGLSERLQKMMCTEPVRQTGLSLVSADEKPSDRTPPLKGGGSHSVSAINKPHETDGDLEGAYHLNDLDPAHASEAASALKSLTFSSIINQIWHFCSVDYGPKYTCIGYNSLYAVKIEGREIDNGKGLPNGKRVWSWIILCNDGTVISIQENAFPGPYRPTIEEERAVLEVVRRNIVSIFSGVSKQHSADSDSESLVTVRVRPLSDLEPDQASIKQEDGPSLLLYYLFDDWISSYRLVARREHMYGAILDDLRRKMLERPQVDLVDDLHWLGKRLAVLKRLYKSYELVMARILQRQRLLRDEARSQRDNHSLANMLNELDFHDSMCSYSMSRSILGPADHYDMPAGVRLSSAAVGRFERLVDRIQLYCLSEIETCLTEKDSLTFMNFNLIALKDSQAVEKLTRITILLAKVTIVFLPVSLLTGYFSTQIQDLQPTFTARSYWISFGVLMFLSIVLLALFGYASDTIEGKTIYQSLSRTFFRSSKARISKELVTETSVLRRNIREMQTGMTARGNRLTSTSSI
ncbi:hypothetical protein VTN77DRAFT_9128 [Rasamsonia byssochlamydoides]|uniref:uncharacterized protein n=1 Tax=Rasamsonia byssochlamydoides TaxID=89139 RepID=UPI003742F131